VIIKAPARRKNSITHRKRQDIDRFVEDNPAATQDKPTEGQGKTGETNERLQSEGGHTSPEKEKNVSQNSQIAAKIRSKWRKTRYSVRNKVG